MQMVYRLSRCAAAIGHKPEGAFHFQRCGRFYGGELEFSQQLQIRFPRRGKATYVPARYNQNVRRSLGIKIVKRQYLRVLVNNPGVYLTCRYFTEKTVRH